MARCVVAMVCSYKVCGYQGVLLSRCVAQLGCVQLSVCAVLKVCSDQDR